MSDDNNSKKKNWFSRHKILTTIIALVLLIVIAGAGSGDKNKSSSSSGSKTSTNSQKQYRFADRADKQKKDVEVLPGETVTIEGVKMTLSNVEYKTSLSDYETAPDGKTYAVADASLENTSDRTKPYNVFNFRIQTAGGQVLDGAITGQPNLSSGDLVAGGKATGKIFFEVPVEDGHQYVVWKPGFSSDRGIVQVK